MTCFWDALRSKLKLDMDNHAFITHLKSNNNKNNNILWNDTKLTDKQIEENFEHVKDFDINSISNGYDCSICDPFLILVCNLYNANINHNYNGHVMKYVNSESNNGQNKPTYEFGSNRGHFW